MELRQLRYLIAVNESSTFVKAAERLHIAQPALSRQIQSLENEIGTKLFVRSRTGVSLTPGGAVCVGAARSIVRKADAAMQRARMADAGHVGKCSIYVSAWTLFTGFSARLVAHLKATEPGITISLEEAGPGGHWGSVSEGAVDLAISTKPPPQFTGLVSEPLFDDVADTAILPLGHRLANRTSIDIHELKDDLFLVYEPTLINYVDHDLEAEFAWVNFTPSATRYFSSTEGLLAMVTSGFGWSIHRRSLRGKIPNVAMVPLRNFSLHFPVTLVRRKGRVPPVLKTVIRRIRELAAVDYPDMYVHSTKEAPASQPQDRPFSHDNKLELRDLRYFVTTVEERTVGRAAQKLGITQPALSRQLKGLEDDLGVELLARSPRGVKTTPAGDAFLTDATRILAEVERLPHELARGERAVSGSCVMGVVPSGEVQALVTEVIRTAATSFPDIDLHLRNVATPLQPAAIHDGTLDFGICHPFPGLVAAFPDLDCRELLHDVIDSALVSEDHPLAARASIDISELSQIPFLFFRREFHPAFHDYLMEAFRNKGFRPLEGAMQEGLQTMWALTAAGEGWSLGFGRQRNNPPRGLVAVPIRDLAIPWGVVLVRRRDESRPIALAVMDIVNHAAQSQRD
jgi:DNA-binding transcriptional LysR family regulator